VSAMEPPLIFVAQVSIAFRKNNYRLMLIFLDIPSAYLQ